MRRPRLTTAGSRFWDFQAVTGAILLLLALALTAAAITLVHRRSAA